MKQTVTDNTLSKVYDWITRVVIRQQRWLPTDDLWSACPFKKDITKDEFSVLVEKMQSVTN